MTAKKIAYSAVFLALGVTLGYAFSWIPNVELVSLVCFLSGYWLGFQFGITTGMGIYMLYSFLSPYGMAPIPLWLTQGIGGAFFSFLGALAARCKTKLTLIGIAMGFVGTLFYDAITSITGFILFPTEDTFLVYIAGGLPFYGIHLLSNTIIFASALPVIDRLKGNLRT